MASDPSISASAGPGISSGAGVGARASEQSHEQGQSAGLGPYRLGLRRLRRNKAALAFGALFLLIVVLCLLRAAVRGPRRAHGSRTRTT